MITEEEVEKVYDFLSHPKLWHNKKRVKEITPLLLKFTNEVLLPTLMQIQKFMLDTLSELIKKMEDESDV